MATLPWRIQAMINQMGGRGFNGALLYTGASQLTFKDDDPDRTPTASRFDKETGAIHFDVGLMFKVNMRHGQTWKVVVALDPGDTYSVYLLHVAGIKTFTLTCKLSDLADSYTGVYAEMLQDIVQTIYDKELGSGGIPI